MHIRLRTSSTRNVFDRAAVCRLFFELTVSSSVRDVFVRSDGSWIVSTINLIAVIRSDRKGRVFFSAAA